MCQNRLEESLHWCNSKTCYVGIFKSLFLKCVVLSYVIISFGDCTYKFIQLHIYVSILFGLKHFNPKFDIMAWILTCKLSRFYFK
jgi:hypothetical protein